MRSLIRTISKERYFLREVVKNRYLLVEKENLEGAEKISPAENRCIVTINKRSRRKTAPEIVVEINKTRKEPESVARVTKGLVEGDFRGCAAAKKPFLKVQNKRKRLQ